MIKDTNTLLPVGEHFSQSNHSINSPHPHGKRSKVLKLTTLLQGKGWGKVKDPSSHRTSLILGGFERLVYT